MELSGGEGVRVRIVADSALTRGGHLLFRARRSMRGAREGLLGVGVGVDE